MDRGNRHRHNIGAPFSIRVVRFALNRKCMSETRSREKIKWKVKFESNGLNTSRQRWLYSLAINVICMEFIRWLWSCGADDGGGGGAVGSTRDTICRCYWDRSTDTLLPLLLLLLCICDVCPPSSSTSPSDAWMCAAFRLYFFLLLLLTFPRHGKIILNHIPINRNAIRKQ